VVALTSAALAYWQINMDRVAHIDKIVNKVRGAVGRSWRDYYTFSEFLRDILRYCAEKGIDFDKELQTARNKVD
jgi:hypothetical protein